MVASGTWWPHGSGPVSCGSGEQSPLCHPTGEAEGQPHAILCLQPCPRRVEGLGRRMGVPGDVPEEGTWWGDMPESSDVPPWCWG